MRISTSGWTVCPILFLIFDDHLGAAKIELTMQLIREGQVNSDVKFQSQAGQVYFPAQLDSYLIDSMITAS